MINLSERRVLVLDGELRSALAVVRSLGRSGAEVIVGASTPRSLSGESKFTIASEQYPDPSKFEADFIERISALCRQYQITDLLPISEISLGSILRHRDRFTVNLPFVDKSTYDRAIDKYGLGEIAGQVGIQFPRSVLCTDRRDVDQALKQMQFPIVLKPVCSRLFYEGQWVSTRVEYAMDASHLATQLEKSQFDHPFMIQEFIKGAGAGVFFLFNQGVEVARFSHARLREKPPSGGVSVLSESCMADSLVFQQASKLLEALRWHGVAMVEFKMSDSGVPYLMEINPRFWGSLQLAIDAGVDFPALLLVMNTQDLKPVSEFRLKVRSRWLLGDLDHLFIVVKSKDFSLSQKIKTLSGFLNFFSLNTRYDTLQVDDIRPFLYELRLYLRTLLFRQKAG